MMDLVYTFRYDSKVFNKNLIYSLRSVEKHLKGVGNVYVVGFKPMLPGVIHIEHQDLFSAGKNIFNKILKACNTPEISDDFMWLADDHYFIKDVEAATYPYYSNGSLQGLIITQNNAYKNIIRNTSELFGGGGRNFNVHCPAVFNKEKFKLMAASYKLDNPLGYLTKSLYCNHYNLFEGKERIDIKIRNNFNPDEMRARIGPVDCFSTGKEDKCPNIMKFLEMTYPNKSQFE